MGALGGLLGASWELLAVSWVVLGVPQGPEVVILVILGCCWGLLERCWSSLGASWGALGISWRHLGMLLGSFWSDLTVVLGGSGF